MKMTFICCDNVSMSGYVGCVRQGPHRRPLSSSWTIMCLTRLELCRNSWPHISHMNCLWSEWISMCDVRPVCDLKALPQISHGIFLSAIWRKATRYTNYQTKQCSSIFCWYTKCTCILNHIVHNQYIYQVLKSKQENYQGLREDLNWWVCLFWQSFSSTVKPLEQVMKLFPWARV